MLEFSGTSRRYRNACATGQQCSRQSCTDATGCANDPYTHSVPVAYGPVQTHERLRKVRITSPSRTPNLLITDRLSIT